MKLTAVIFAAVLAAVQLAVVRSHGGGLHNWAFSPQPTRSDRLVIRREVAKCSSFKPLPLTEDSPVTLVGLPSILPVFPGTASSNLEITGDVRLWWYLGANCSYSPNNGMEVIINVQKDGQPYADKPIWGYAFTGNCSAPGDVYRNRADGGDDFFNVNYWRKENVNTDEDGNMWGTGTYGYLTRLPGEPLPLTSIVLYPFPGDSLPMCCELEYPAETMSWDAFVAQGLACKDDTHGPSGKVIPWPPADGMGSAPGGDMMDMGHGHDMTPAPAPATARTPATATGAVPAPAPAPKAAAPTPTPAPKPSAPMGMDHGSMGKTPAPAHAPSTAKTPTPAPMNMGGMGHGTTSKTPTPAPAGHSAMGPAPKRSRRTMV